MIEDDCDDMSSEGCRSAALQRGVDDDDDEDEDDDEEDDDDDDEDANKDAICEKVAVAHQEGCCQVPLFHLRHLKVSPDCIDSVQARNTCSAST